MRFAFFSCEATSLPMWSRLLEEGHDVMVFNSSKLQEHVGEGLVDLTSSATKLMEWAAAEPSVTIFDGNESNGWGDRFRKRGLPTIGGGSLCNDLEGKREWVYQIAQTLGIKVPLYRGFKTVDESIAWLKSNGGKREGWYFKSNKFLESDSTFGGEVDDLIGYLKYIQGRFGNNISHVLQEKLQGVALSTGAWWNGRSFLEPFEGTIEHKKHLNDDLGSSTGCSMNLLWMYQDYPQIARKLQWEALGQLFLRLGAVPGIYDINAVVNKKDREPYFLEFTPRFGYDSEPTALKLLTRPLGFFYESLATSKLESVPFSTGLCALSLRLSVQPYPWEHLDDKVGRRSAAGTPVWGADGLSGQGHFTGYGLQLQKGVLCVADPQGLVGLSTATGTNLKTMSEEVLKYAKEELHVPSLQYRTDVYETLKEDVEELQEMGYDIPVRT